MPEILNVHEIQTYRGFDENAVANLIEAGEQKKTGFCLTN